MVQARYYDGRSARVNDVTLSVCGDDLVVAGENVNLRIPFPEVSVDERLGRAPRRLRLKEGAFCEVRDLDGLDTLLRSTGHRDGWVDRMQRHLQFVVFSLFGCVALVGAAYKWGLPWAAAEGAHHLPPAMVNTLSAQTMKILDGRVLEPSRIPLERQEALREDLHKLERSQGGVPESALLFRRSRQLGANAFTMPDGSIIVLDELIIAIGDDQQILAVFAHELGHAQGRHGLQLLLRTSAVSAFWAFYAGDVSSLLVAAPAALVRARYSQAFERQADEYGAALLMHDGKSPALLKDALNKIARSHEDSSNGGYLSSHPSTAERMRRLDELAASFEKE